MESKRRRKDISWGARPGDVGEEERICEMWIGFPVRVERTRRVVRCWWVVKRRYSGAGVVIVVLFRNSDEGIVVSLDERDNVVFSADLKIAVA